MLKDVPRYQYGLRQVRDNRNLFDHFFVGETVVSGEAMLTMARERARVWQWWRPTHPWLCVAHKEFYFVACVSWSYYSRTDRWLTLLAK